MKINPNYKLRTIAGEHIIVNQGGSHADMTRIISLNPSACMLWQALEGREFTTSEAADLLVEKYGIANEQALTDAAHWIERLQAVGAIVQ